ncbi:MAG: hypothetical protein JSR91_19285 [Proteobacteria bacterium]|nr:hypothetical protein [Pseudomonadota bacterium]
MGGDTQTHLGKENHFGWKNQHEKASNQEEGRQEEDRQESCEEERREESGEEEGSKEEEDDLVPSIAYDSAPPKGRGASSFVARCCGIPAYR